MSYQTPTHRVIETGLRRTRTVELTDEQVAADEAKRAALEVQLKAALGLDHHWDAEHPEYDPTCECGLSPEQRLQMARSMAAGAEYEAELPAVRRGRRAMSTNQRAYLERLAPRVLDPALHAALQAALAGEKMTWGEASRLIDQIKQALANQVRPNRFPGECRHCGGHIDAQAGHLSNVDGRWVVEHVEACPEPSDEEPEVIGLDLRNLHPGRYAVPGGDTRLKLLVQRPIKGDWAGYTFVSDAAEYGMRKRYGRQGPGENDRYRGEVVEALEAILADPMAAMAAYGHLTGTCGVCGRPLENEESIERGIGPVCAGAMMAGVL